MFNVDEEVITYFWIVSKCILSNRRQQISNAMGNKESSIKSVPSSEPQASNNNLENLLRNAIRIAYSIPIADLYVYRDEIIPLVDKIIGKRESMISIKIDRNKIFEEATGRFVGKVKQLAKISSPVHEKPVITFNDTDILDVDGSGFRREYYSVYFRKCIANLFEGQGRQMLPKKDCTKKDELKALGIAIVECVLNGDCGFPYLHRGIYKAIIGCTSDEIDQHCNLNDIPDGEVRMIVQQLNDAKSDEEITEIIASDVASFINYVGWPVGKIVTMTNRHVLLQYILRWFIIDHRQNEIDQLRHGLSYMGFLDAIKSNDWFEPLFVYSEQYSITARYMKDKLNPVLEKLEAKTEKETNCVKFAKACIDSLDDTQARLLFAFITNLNDPPLEEESLEVIFNTHNPDRLLPESYTCLNRLLLPLGNKDINHFRESFFKAIMEQ
ncbi:uncharacterized protein LOC134685308 isoform X1 [Mytilus trossulus]|uniref:uncharacterized protein LOC134685308 isoform X1 n=2 Tax=Mytilus trossulus TaxID=6551 RepID=UPI0030061C8E